MPQLTQNLFFRHNQNHDFADRRFSDCSTATNTG
jgi:hypothetical protein